VTVTGYAPVYSLPIRQVRLLDEANYEKEWELDGPGQVHSLQRRLRDQEVRQAVAGVWVGMRPPRCSVSMS
jgi:hypothetical protein